MSAGCIEQRLTHPIGWLQFGNCVATVVVAAGGGDRDRKKSEQVLSGRDVVDATAG
jgi:hypothetical protein